MTDTCLCNFKQFAGEEIVSKLTDMLNDATDSSPAALAQKALGQAQKLSDVKSVVSQGIASFKNRFGLPSGRIDGLGGLDLGQIKEKAQALKAKAAEVQSVLSDFQSAFPGCAAAPEIANLIDAVASIDLNLDPFSRIDAAKLEGEIAEARAKIEAALDLRAHANELKNLLTGCP